MQKNNRLLPGFSQERKRRWQFRLVSFAVLVFRLYFVAFQINVCITGGTKKWSSQSKIWGEADSRAVPGDKSTKCDPV